MPAYSLGELAGQVDAYLEGDPEVEIVGVARLEDAGPEDLSFLANPRYAQHAAESNAGALVVDTEYRANGQNVLRSENPYLTFAHAVELILPARLPSPGIAATASVSETAIVPKSASIGQHVVIGDDVSVGEDVIVGAGVVIEKGVTIGAGTHIFPRATIHSGTRIGNECLVQSGAVLGSDGFGYATDDRGQHQRVPQRGGLVLGDRVDIGAGATIDRGSAGDTTVGEGTKIDNLVHLAHNVQIGRNAFIVAQVGIAGSTRIGDWAVLGGQAGLVGHIDIGDRARIGAQAGVIGDIPADAEYSGYPARPHREQMKAHAAFARLPDILSRLKKLEERMKER